MANAATGSMTAAQAQQLNLNYRQTLLATSPRCRKNLGSSNITLGQTTRVKAFNVGLTTGFRYLVTFPVTIATAVAVASAKAPYNLINKVRVTDFNGTDRVNVTGFQLYILNCVRYRQAYGWNNDGPIYNSQGSAQLGGVFTNPSVPTAIGNGTVSFFMEIPLAFDPSADLRGAIMAQTAVGEFYLNFDINPNLGGSAGTGDVESVYSGTSGTVVLQTGQTGTIQVWQDYLLPQAMSNGQLPVPFYDVATVYELAGSIRSSDNLAQGTEKLISYPNVRSVIGAYFSLIQNGTMVNTNLQQIRLIANGNNVLKDETPNLHLLDQRNALNGDVAFATYWNLHRDFPIQTTLYGNMQIGFTPNTNFTFTGNTYVEWMFESFYTNGAALPGTIQG